MGDVIRIGMDTSKRVFQLHGVDAEERVVLRRKLKRGDVLSFFAKLPPTRIGIEACGGSHYWARELRALGHAVVLIPPQYVKPYVDRGKNDAADAEAICEAMSRPKVEKRRVSIKTVEQQSAQMLIGVREGLLKRRTQVSNTIRGHAAEFGLVAPKGLAHLEPLLARIEADDTVAGACAVRCLRCWPGSTGTCRRRSARSRPDCWTITVRASKAAGWPRYHRWVR